MFGSSFHMFSSTPSCSFHHLKLFDSSLTDHRVPVWRHGWLITKASHHQRDRGHRDSVVDVCRYSMFGAGVCEDGKGRAAYAFGVSAMQGWREAMEENHGKSANIKTQKTWVFEF